MTQRREIRKAAKPLFGKMKFLEETGMRWVLRVDESVSGLSGIVFGEQFPGRGSIMANEKGQLFIVRWARHRFGFFYRFGLESY